MKTLCHSREGFDQHLDTIQVDLDQLREVLVQQKSQIDAATLLGVCHTIQFHFQSTWCADSVDWNRKPSLRFYSAVMWCRVSSARWTSTPDSFLFLKWIAWQIWLIILPSWHHFWQRNRNDGRIAHFLCSCLVATRLWRPTITSPSIWICLSFHRPLQVLNEQCQLHLAVKLNWSFKHKIFNFQFQRMLLLFLFPSYRLIWFSFYLTFVHHVLRNY